MKKEIISIVILFISFGIYAQETAFTETEISIDKYTDGTLTVPTSGEAKDLVIFIQGSGPVDRNGNAPMNKNDGAKKMARALAENNIASFRYDKRIFKMDELKIQEKDLRVEDFVKDAEAIIDHFRSENQFENIIIAGHSEGSLIGMLAAKGKADAFISLAGAGEPIDNIIVEQINKQAPSLAENARKALDEIKANGQTSSYNPMLQSLFRPDVQPYMNSWMKYDPAKEIKELAMPVLIINGTSDVQVDAKEAELLKQAKPDAKLVILDNMNHIFREIESKDLLVNTKSYNEPNLPLHSELIPTITDFIKEIE